MTIIFITPSSKGGVSDYADRARVSAKGVSVIDLKIETHKNINLEILSNKSIFLQYSGYGYAKRGAPLWLLKTLQEEKENFKTLGIFFHELYATGPPWGSAFWLSPVQKHIARRLAELSDFWITNREGSAQWLRQFAGDKPHAVLPVFSNVGEMPEYSFVRAPKIVVFGSAALRTATYLAAGNALFTWAREQGLEIHDIGPAINDIAVLKSLQAARVVLHGRLANEEVSRQLSDVSFGILAYPLDYVAKSGVFAAYCAHGVCPVLISTNFPAADGLVANKHYLAGLPVSIELGWDIKKIGSTAWEWYQLHNVKTHLFTIKSLFRDAGTA